MINYFSNLTKNKSKLIPGSKFYEDQKKINDDLMANFFHDFNKFYDINFFEFGLINFPYVNMGNVNTKNLFNIDEMINLSFYFAMKKKYNHVADLGANIGLHTLILSKCFDCVDSFEPLKFHYDFLKKVVEVNKLNNVNVFNKAVTINNDPFVDFVHVKDNSTGSHILDYKESYGDRDFIRVDATNILNIIHKYDFVKMDIEGYEIEVLSSLSSSVYEKTDFLIEVGNEDIALQLMDLSKKLNFSIYPQKNAWKKAKNYLDIPFSCHEGNVILSSKNEFSW